MTIGLNGTSRFQLAAAAQPQQTQGAPQRPPTQIVGGPTGPKVAGYNFAGNAFQRGGLAGSNPPSMVQGLGRQFNPTNQFSQTAGPAQRDMGRIHDATQNTNGGVAPGQMSGQPAYGGYQAPPVNQGVPTLDQLQQDMQRQQVGAQLNANPQNSALAGYMMG